jgi:hypothetical protein
MEAMEATVAEVKAYLRFLFFLGSTASGRTAEIVIKNASSRFFLCYCVLRK